MSLVSHPLLVCLFVRYLSRKKRLGLNTPLLHRTAAPGPQTALKCMSDVATRSQTLHMMIMDPSIMLPIMGLACVDYGDEIKEKSKALVDCLEAVKGS